MKKLALQVETLSVESFPTEQAASALRGTVQGAEATPNTYCGTCGVSCYTSCAAAAADYPVCTCPVRATVAC
jgi:hypothetical protein